MNEDYWHPLKKYTNARIAMGRAGHALPTGEVLQFRMAHALAKDAVYSEMDNDGLKVKLSALGMSVEEVHSQAEDRNIYLRSPNHGRLLHAQSRKNLIELNAQERDLCIIVADGLSAEAVNLHAVPVIELLVKELPQWTLTPVILAKQARVALSDEIGELQKARIALILIGERPGLSSPDSMGAYITYLPRVGNTDERRNCISNIQPAGLSYELAASKIAHLLQQMKALKISGVQLKDNYGENLIN
jgi:ethanolamine ammonia-lyase small subunit